MKVRVNKEKLDKLSPEDALPLIIKIRRFILGKKKPDGFTRLIFTINIFIWFLLMIWNLISYIAIQLSDIIKENKGFSVNAIIRKNGRDLGFEGQGFLEVINTYLFANIFIWIVIFIGLALLYRKLKIYPILLLGGLSLHFLLMFFMLGLQYFIESVSFFDKILYAILILTTMIHSALMKKEQNDPLKTSSEDDSLDIVNQ